MGAGDGRFAHFGHYDRYHGIEIDETRAATANLEKPRAMETGCVFASKSTAFDACIGNPPYLRHHDIESPWKERTLATLGSLLGVSLHGHCNLFVYFLALGLIRSNDEGLVSVIVPFDWVTRPAAEPLRNLIKTKRWAVSVYRFSSRIFAGVETTASITVIDKSKNSGKWQFFNISEDLKITQRDGVTGTGKKLLSYSRRQKVFARRGISPGTQRVFVLTDSERIHHGLKRTDVLPCVTSLRDINSKVDRLTKTTFEEHFVKAGRRCWLIKSRGRVSSRLRGYLDGVSDTERSTATCLRQKPWYKYEEPVTPLLLVHSAFTRIGPRIIVNAVNAVAVGSMYGIYGASKNSVTTIQRVLATKGIGQRIVPHSGRLRKIEVGQLNSLLGLFGTR